MDSPFATTSKLSDVHSFPTWIKHARRLSAGHHTGFWPQKNAWEPLQRPLHEFLVPQAVLDASRNSLRSGQKVLTKEDWEVHRSTIVRLYKDEDHTLKDVMHIMHTRYGFKASTKMYKSRFPIWNVRKYMTQAERGTACRPIKRATSDNLGNTVVGEPERRHGLPLGHMGQSRARHRQKRPVQNGHERDDSIIGGTKGLQSSLSLWPVMYRTTPERAASIICTEIPHLIVAKPENALTFELREFMQAACDRTSIKRYADAIKLVNSAAQWYSEAIAAQPARALMSLLQIPRLDASQFYQTGHFTRFYRHLFDLTTTRYGLQHSFTSLLVLILQLAYDFELMTVAYQNIVTVVFTKLEKANLSGASTWRRELVDTFEHLGQYDKAEALLVKVFELKKSYRDDDQMLYAFYHAWHYINYDHERDEEAEHILLDIQNAGTDEVTGRVNPIYAFYANDGLGKLAEKRYDPEAAVSFYRLHVEAAFNAWGYGDPRTLNAVEDFVAYLRALGREEEAVEVESLTRLTDDFG